MFTLNEDKSIYATRGDIVFFSVSADDDGVPHQFLAGDVVRIKVYGKKNAENVVLQKDFPVTENTESVEIFLTEEDTKIDEVISKPKDYWYEVELNPYDNPQTIIGYDEDGAKVFKLFPEGDDIPEFVPKPDDVAVMDDELDMASTRPVQNQAIARAFTSLSAEFDKTNAKSEAAAEAVSIERARIDNLITRNNTVLMQDLEYLSYITEETKSKIDADIKSDGVHATITVNFREANLFYGGSGEAVFVIPNECRPVDTGLIHTNDGMEYSINYDTVNNRYMLYLYAQGDVVTAPSSAGVVTITYPLGDYETKDIRIDTNGKAYKTAGDAVRGQVLAIKEGYYTLSGDDWVQGYMNSNGLQDYKKARIRNKKPFFVKKNSVISFEGIGNNHWCVYILEDDNLESPTILGNSSDSNYGTCDQIYTVPQDGYVMINLQAKATWSENAADSITPDSFNGYVSVHEYDRICKLRDEIAEMNAANNGYTNTEFSNVTYTDGKGIVASKIRLGMATPIMVRKGEALYVDGLGDLFWCVNLFATDNITADTKAIDSVGWNNDGYYEASQDCYAVVLLANASTYNASTAISPADFTGYVKHLKQDPRFAGVNESLSALDVRIDEMKEGTYPVNTEKVKLFASYFDSESDFEPFLFFTDPHLSQGTGWENQFASYMECLRKYHECTPIYNIFCGGDWLGNGDTRAEACWKLGYINAQMRSFANDFHLVVGNHDTNEQGRFNAETEKWTGALPNDVISNLWYRNHGNPYYSFDTPKTRFFILNSGMESYVADNNQYEWFANSLMANTADNIVLFFHIVRNSSGAVQTFANTITAIARAFNDRTTTTVAGKSYNFANAKGKVRFAMAGHRHVDWNGDVNGIPVVETTHMRTGGVPTFDLCFADYSNGVLNLIRVGTGENRNISI